MKTNASIATKIAKGWAPNQYLTNMSMAYFQKGEYAAKQLFPICPVALSSSFFYTFDKGDLARDNVSRKPAYGKVAPAIMGHTDDTYKCQVDQIIVGIDQIDALNYQRSNAPGAIDPRRAKVRFAVEQMNLHQDILFAKNFFHKGVWRNEWTGDAAADTKNKKFLRFDDANFDPVAFFADRKKEMAREGRRKPNKLALGVDAFTALQNHPDIVERVKYTGTTANPAIVTEQVLAQLFGVEQVVVLDSTYNAAGPGKDADMQYICDSKGALLCYTTPSPQIDEPSAGYIFAWDMLGNGNYIATDQFEGENGTHTEYVEGLISTDMHICAQDLGMYFTDCVG